MTNWVVYMSSKWARCVLEASRPPDGVLNGIELESYLLYTYYYYYYYIGLFHVFYAF